MLCLKRASETVISRDIGTIWLFYDVIDRFVESIYLWKMSHLIIAVISSFSSFAKIIYGLEKARDD